MFCMASNAGDKTNLENGTHTKVGISKDCTEAWCERYRCVQSIQITNLFRFD